MHGYGTITSELYEQLCQIEPARDRDVLYRPCLVLLSDGTMVDRVYVMDAEIYLRHWGVRPEHDRGKRSLPIDSVTAITESPSRLPARLADELYKAGESGMGYCVFTLTFKDGRKQKYVTGNAVDFIALPAGLGSEDIKCVEPHTHPWTDATPSPSYAWCLYSGIGAAA